MTWFRCDDGLADHPKVLSLAETRQYKGAMALWLLAGCWSSKQLTDGMVPRAVVRRLGFSQSDAAALVDHGLWNVSESGGYSFNDWTDYNPSAADVTAKRRATASRVKRHRNGVGNALHGGGGNALETPPRPDPTRPDPSPPTDGGSHVRGVDVRREFSRRFEAARGMPWSPARHQQDSDGVASWLNRADGVALGDLLDRYFADDWTTGAGYPFGALASDPARYAKPPVAPTAASREQDASEAQRRQREEIDAMILGGPAK